jgi:transposase
VEATGRLHHAWVIELERRWPGSVRLFAPSETQAARTQLGSRRYNSDDRDCAALVWLVRQGAGRPAATDTVDALLGAVGHRRGLVADRKVLQPPRPAPGALPRAVSTGRPRPCPGRSDRPGGPGLCGRLRRPAADGAVAAGPSARSASPGPPLGSGSTAGGGCFPHPTTPSCAPSGWAEDLARHRALQADIATVEGQLARLLAATDGQILTTLPGVAAVRAASFAAHSLPIDRFPTADHQYAATGLAPATWQSASLTRRGRSSRRGLPEHRDALRASPGACPNTG